MKVKLMFYTLSVILLTLCGLNVWCVVTKQPSTLHLNIPAAVLTLIAAIVMAYSGWER